MNAQTLRRLQNTEFKILEFFDDVCKKNGLRYCLIGGTLLGAVRHKGFIPWDDDIDVVMPREDYEKFIRLEVGSQYFIQSYLTDPHYSRIFAKIRKRNTVFLEPKSANADYDHGIFIDIFPLDYRSEKESFLFKIRRRVWIAIDGYLDRRESKRKFHMNYQLIDLFLHFIPANTLCKARDKFFSSLPASDSYVNYGSQYNMDKQTFPIAMYEPPILMEFEGKPFCVPNGYTTFLERIYGKNYMELPPVEKRITHSPLKISFNVEEQDAEL